MSSLNGDPFDDVEDDDIQDGSSDELIDMLQRTPDLSAVSRGDLIAVCLSLDISWPCTD